MKKRHKICWIFIGVGILFWTAFTVLPFIQAFFLSFSECKGNVCEFVGLNNYKRLLTDKVFWISLRNVFIYLIVQVPIMLMLGLFFANILNSNELRGRGFFRTAFFLPTITAAVGYSIVFKMLFANTGVVNDFLVNSRLITENIHWLTSPFYAKVLIIISITWKNTGYNMMLYLAAMQNIPKETYEAAWLDGASKTKTFFKITIPQLKPVIFFTMIMSTIGTIQLFDEAVNITGGGPGYETQTLSQYIYVLSFERVPDFGYAAAVSFVIVFLIVILALLQKKIYGGEA